VASIVLRYSVPSLALLILAEVYFQRKYTQNSNENFNFPFDASFRNTYSGAKMIEIATFVAACHVPSMKGILAF